MSAARDGLQRSALLTHRFGSVLLSTHHRLRTLTAAHSSSRLAIAPNRLLCPSLTVDAGCDAFATALSGIHHGEEAPGPAQAERNQTAAPGTALWLWPPPQRVLSMNRMSQLMMCSTHGSVPQPSRAPRHSVSALQPGIVIVAVTLVIVVAVRWAVLASRCLLTRDPLIHLAQVYKVSSFDLRELFEQEFPVYAQVCCSPLAAS